jgi:hypothetical protein
MLLLTVAVVVFELATASLCSLNKAASLSSANEGRLYPSKGGTTVFGTGAADENLGASTLFFIELGSS